MKRTAITLGLAAAVVLGAPAAAQASTGHHKAHDCQSSCRHTPRPPGGWPCSATHTCKPPKPCPRHHHHHKPPVKPDPQPPVVVTPRPPVRVPAKPSTPAVHRSIPATPTAELPRTGSDPAPLALGGLLLLGAGAGLYRGSKWERS